MFFSKYSGAGNDFILIDNRDASFSPALVPSLCSRHEGIGADGIILLEKGNTAEFLMRIFNADGSEAEMCGNGLRAYVKFLEEIGLKKEKYEIENIEGRFYEASLTHEGEVKLKMPPPSEVKWNISLIVNKKKQVLHYLNTGVPHAVLFCDNVEKIDVENEGRSLRNHPHFHPKGTNVDFVALDNNNIVHLRTYERGVENETLACGTGSVAAALAVANMKSLPSPILVKVRSNNLLKIEFTLDKGLFSEVALTGPAKKIFEGSFPI